MSKLTPKQIAKMLDTLAVIEKIGESVRAHAIELIHSGTVIPGYEKDFTAVRRMWADEEKANTLLQRLGLEKRERYKVELLSPAQAEKMLRSKKLWPKKPKGSAGEDFANPFDAVLDYTDTKPTIRKVREEAEAE